MHWADLAFVLSLCEYYDLCGSHARVSASINLFHSRRRRENSFVSVLEDDIDGLVEALQRSDEVAAVGGDDGHQTVDVLLQRRGHGNEIWIVSRMGTNQHSSFRSKQPKSKSKCFYFVGIKQRATILKVTVVFRFTVRISVHTLKIASRDRRSLGRWRWRRSASRRSRSAATAREEIRDWSCRGRLGRGCRGRGCRGWSTKFGRSRFRRWCRCPATENENYLG